MALDDVDDGRERMGQQLTLAGTAARRRRGPWERRAEQHVAAMRRAGTLDPLAAGYGDALRMAGRDRDAVEADDAATPWARDVTRKGWDAALSRLVPAPTDTTTGGDDADPFAALERHLASRSTVGDAPNT